MGASGVEHVALPQLWRSMCAGNKLCEAFSELCFEEPDRQGVGISRFAEVMAITIDRLLASPHYQAVLKTELWDAVKAEAQGFLGAEKAKGLSEVGEDPVERGFLGPPQQAEMFGRCVFRLALVA